MKHSYMKVIGITLLAVVLLTLSTQILVSAQNVFNEEKGEEQSREHLGKLVGVWNVQVTRLSCQTGEVIATVPAMLTYMQGGTMIDWGTGNSPSLRSVGQGVWRHQVGRRYISAFQFFRFNADGTLAGRQIVRTQIVLSPDGNSLTNTAMAQILDVNGNVIGTNCSTATATRFE